MLLELHILQNFAPSNLNRDDTGSPKDCVYGGYRRARISSQCLKRAIRRHPAFADRIEKAGGDMSVRTRYAKKRLVELLVARGKEADAAEKVAESMLKALKLDFDKKNPERTEYLLYLGNGELQEMADVACEESAWKELSGLSSNEEGKNKSKTEKSAGSVAKLLKGVISEKKLGARAYAPDIALFGRMMADDKDLNVDASCQVAHAISTHQAEMEIDFFTAVDDLNTDDAGAGMMGTGEFTSACFYRYAVVDIDSLKKQLAHNSDLTSATVLGFVESAMKAVPSGKKNSTAPQNPPFFVRAVLRNDGFPWALTGAFSRPVRVNAKDEKSLEEKSVEALESFETQLRKMYGDSGIIYSGTMSIFDDNGKSLGVLLEELQSVLAGAEV